MLLLFSFFTSGGFYPRLHVSIGIEKSWLHVTEYIGVEKSWETRQRVV